MMEVFVGPDSWWCANWHQVRICKVATHFFVSQDITLCNASYGDNLFRRQLVPSAFCIDVCDWKCQNAGRQVLVGVELAEVGLVAVAGRG